MVYLFIPWSIESYLFVTNCIKQFVILFVLNDFKQLSILNVIMYFINYWMFKYSVLVLIFYSNVYNRAFIYIVTLRIILGD